MPYCTKCKREIPVHDAPDIPGRAAARQMLVDTAVRVHARGCDGKIVDHPPKPKGK